MAPEKTGRMVERTGNANQLKEKKDLNYMQIIMMRQHGNHF